MRCVAPEDVFWGEGAHSVEPHNVWDGRLRLIEADAAPKAHWRGIFFPTLIAELDRAALPIC